MPFKNSVAALICSVVGACSAGDVVWQADTPIRTVEKTVLAPYAPLFFPEDMQSVGRDWVLGDAGRLFPWHSYVNADTSAAVLNRLSERLEGGAAVFYPIYPETVRDAEPRKRSVGLFYFPGPKKAPFAVISAGGGFAYVGSLHESLPHALWLSQHGIHAFALQYRTGSAEAACEDLAAAIDFIFRRADAFGLDLRGYSLWGGSAGARMAAYLGTYGPSAFGAPAHPRSAAVIMQYTGHRDVSHSDPATYACIGTHDAIASPHVMKRRTEILQSWGIPAQIEIFEGLPHGFGLGIGTPAEGWIHNALQFWLNQRNLYHEGNHK